MLSPQSTIAHRQQAVRQEDAGKKRPCYVGHPGSVAMWFSSFWSALAPAAFGGRLGTLRRGTALTKTVYRTVCMYVPGTKVHWSGLFLSALGHARPRWTRTLERIYHATMPRWCCATFPEPRTCGIHVAAKGTGSPPRVDAMAIIPSQPANPSCPRPPGSPPRCGPAPASTLCQMLASLKNVLARPDARCLPRLTCPPSP